MSEIRNFTEANAALLPYVPLVAQLTGKNTTLQRIRPLLELLGNPQNSTRTIHIAGTSGKTSTAYFTAALLRASGKRVGLTVSPHVDSVAERVQIDGVPVSEQVFCEGLGEFLDIIKAAPERPSYFELLYAFSFWMFQRLEVDYAVIETGMGGLHDATNTIDRADKLCIITDIGYDHMHVLGHTLKEIATQKAGIIQHRNPVITYQQSVSITDVIAGRAMRQQAELILTSQAKEQAVFGKPLPKTMPEYQQRNWLLAYRAYKFLAERDGLPKLTAPKLLQTQKVQVPARMDRRKVGTKTIIMDGAHNGQKMNTFLSSFVHAYPKKLPAVLLALKQGKELQDVAPLLAPIASRIIVTTFNTSQDLPAVSIEPAELVASLQAAGAKNVIAIPNQLEAYQALLAGPEDVYIITGSFYLISQLRQAEKLA